MANDAIPFYSGIDLKQNLLKQALVDQGATFPTTPKLGQLWLLTAAVAGYTVNHLYMFDGTNWVDLSQVLTNVQSIKGEISNANTSPAYPGSPSVGDTYIITQNAGTVGGQPVEIGDELVYSTSGWFILQRNLSAATTTSAGFIRLATLAELIAASDSTIAVTPATLAGYLANYLYARKARVVIASLVANTTTTVTHGLNVANAEDVSVTVWQGGQQIFLAVTTLSVNAIQITSNVALSNLTVIVQG